MTTLEKSKKLSTATIQPELKTKAKEKTTTIKESSVQKEYKKDPNDLERVFLREFGNFGITIYKASDENISNWNKLEMNGDIINPQVNEIPCN